MRVNRKTFASIVLAGTGILMSLQAAGAASCAANMKGKWSLHVIEVGPKGAANAIACPTLNIATNGSFSGASCTAYTAAMNGSDSATISGTITVASCVLSGSITIPGDPSVTIRSGRVNGNIAAGIATQGTSSKTQVLHFTLVKQ
jgi:hypothetical protein